MSRMRTAFIETLIELAQDDERIMLLTADLGWSVLERFAGLYPDRFLNVGVAEQNMVGIATGLAREGFVPFVYSIATFSSMRCYEQLRDGAILHQLPVRVIGIGGGFAYGHAGPTHYALEDLSIARTQPGLTVIAPADRTQARRAIQEIVNFPGPAYLRLDKTIAPDIDGLCGRFELGTPEVVREGRDVLLLATGSISHEALKAVDLLERCGVQAGFAVLAHLGFEGTPRIRDLLAAYPAVLTVEEGYSVGGLGSLIAETIAQNALPSRLSIRGVKERLTSVTGGTEYMRRRHGLDAASLADAALVLLQAAHGRRVAA
jgi:transketolase